LSVNTAVNLPKVQDIPITVQCLWSKHVDVNPGDRKSECGGPMKPIATEVKGDGYIIYYQCERCGYEHRVKSSLGDNLEKILELAKEPIPN